MLSEPSPLKTELKILGMAKKCLFGEGCKGFRLRGERGTVLSKQASQAFEIDYFVHKINLEDRAGS